jgi:hypothetical protein
MVSASALPSCWLAIEFVSGYQRCSILWKMFIIDRISITHFKIHTSAQHFFCQQWYIKPVRIKSCKI